MESPGKQEIGFPENSDEEDTENLAQQYADYAIDGSQAERDGKIEHQFRP